MKKHDEPAEDFKEKYLRALADYHNLQRQTDTWREEFSSYASASLIKKILDIVDDLEKAEEHIKDDGLNLIISKLKNILTSEGLEELNLDGQEFNPAMAEVISTEPNEQPNIILKTIQKGYKLKEKIIRPARVIVSIAQTNDVIARSEATKQSLSDNPVI